MTMELTKKYEGLRLSAYPDPGTGGEPWTIGYGHTGGVRRGDVCTQAQADAWLAADLAAARRAVLARVTVPLNSSQLDALTDFVFNIGAKQFRSSTLLKKLNARDYGGAANEFLRWNKAAGKVLPGLARRRAAEKALFEAGV